MTHILIVPGTDLQPGDRFSPFRTAQSARDAASYIMRGINTFLWVKMSPRADRPAFAVVERLAERSAS